MTSSLNSWSVSERGRLLNPDDEFGTNSYQQAEDGEDMVEIMIPHQTTTIRPTSRTDQVILSKTQFKWMMGYTIVVTICLLGLIVTLTTMNHPHTTQSTVTSAPTITQHLTSPTALIQESSTIAPSTSTTTSHSTSSKQPPIHHDTTTSSIKSKHEESVTRSRHDDDSAGGDDEPTFDQQIFPSHLPWSISSPRTPTPPPSTTPPATPAECNGLDGNRAREWIGPVAYSNTPYLPPHHFHQHLPRFLHLTDIHLEYAYDPEEMLIGGPTPGVCRRVSQNGEEIGIDWTTTQEHHNNHHHRYHHPHDATSFPFGRANCDTPIELLESSLDLLTSLASPIQPTNETRELDFLLNSNGDDRPLPPYEFLLLTGDLVAHFVEGSEIHAEIIQHAISRTVAKLGARVRGELGQNIIPVIGNTDLYPTNYIEDTSLRVPFKLTTSDETQADHYNQSSNRTTIDCHPAFQRLLDIYTSNGLIQDVQAQRDFCQGGYYSSLLPHLRLRIVVLNSVIYSPFFMFDPAIARALEDWTSESRLSQLDTVAQFPIGVCDDILRQDDPYQQFAWLRATFKAAEEAQERVIIVGHIPPGHKDGISEFAWCDRYASQYRKILAKHSNIILSHLFGDFSEDLTRLIYASDELSAEEVSTPQPNTHRHHSRHASIDFSHLLDSREVSPANETESNVVLPVSSLFIAPGLSPRKHTNPSVRIWYLEPDTSTATTNFVDGATTHPSSTKSTNISSSAEHSTKSSATLVSSDSLVHLYDYSQWYLPLQYANMARPSGDNTVSHWQYHYSFRSSFDLSSLQPRSLARWYDQLTKNPTHMLQYQMHATVNQPTGPTYSDYLCDLRYMDSDRNQECRKTGN